MNDEQSNYGYYVEFYDDELEMEEVVFCETEEELNNVAKHCEENALYVKSIKFGAKKC